MYKGFNGGFGGGNIGMLMKQAQKVQEDMQRAKAELDQTVFKASVSGGLVEVEMTGDRNLKAIKIKREGVDPDDVEMLEDLVMAGVNDALKQISDKEKELMPALPMGM